MFLSFIIPIFNCELYIKQSLDIITSSKLLPDGYEIILVDDGSTDKSAEICKRYAISNKNIQYFYQKNQGPATARNTGLKHATGDYIWFVDADDRINPDILLKLKAVANSDEGIDLISFGYVSQTPDGDHTMSQVEDMCSCSGLEFLKMSRHGSYLWNNIYRRTAIGDVLFLDGVSHIEDMCFNIQTILKFKHVVCLPDVGYYYNRCNTGSISNGRFLRGRVKANEDSYRVYQTLYQEMNNTKDGVQRDFIRRSLNFNINAHIYTMMRFDNVKTLKKYIRLYREMGLYPLSPTGNRKGDLFMLVANRPRLLFALVKMAGSWRRFLNYKSKK